MSFDISSIKARKNKKKKKAIIFLLFLLLIAVLSTIILSIGYFDIKNIDVFGHSYLDKQEIIKYSQIVMGKNIFKLNKSEAIDNLNSHPFIKQTYIKAKLPDTVEVTIIEREIIGAIAYLGSYVFIDKDGFILKIHQSLDEIQYPVIVGIHLDPPKVGNEVRVEDRGKLDSILNLIEEINHADLSEQIKTIESGKEDNIRLICKRNNQIYIKIEKDYSYKIAFLKEILEYLRYNGVGAGYINMMHNGNPVYSPTKEWED